MNELTYLKPKKMNTIPQIPKPMHNIIFSVFVPIKKVVAILIVNYKHHIHLTIN